METKSFWKSKTLWLNVIAIAGMVAEYFIANQIYSPETHAIVLAVINFGLRLVTNTGLTK